MTSSTQWPAGAGQPAIKQDWPQWRSRRHTRYTALGHDLPVVAHAPAQGFGLDHVLERRRDRRP